MTDEGDGEAAPGPAERLALRERLHRLINAYEISAAIGAVARLGVADALAGGPAAAAELAARVGADARSLERVLRSLADAGVFRKLDDDRFALTALGDLLRADAPDSVRMGAIVSTEEWLWRAYGHFTHAVRTGEPGFLAGHGCGFWEYLDRHPEDAAAFNAHMSQSVALRAAAFARGYDFSGVERLVDVGGGHGVLMRAVLEAHPHLRGIVFDLPRVVE